MLISSDIKNNKKLPKFIKNCDIFNQFDRFDKIFPHIGLHNFEKNIVNIALSLSFCFKQILFAISFNKALMPQRQTLRRLSWTLLGLPLLMLDMFSDSIEILKIRGKNANLKICFSSEGFDGAWDIATMSMRGVSSCQTWGSVGQREKLLGSIIDPCCGIIYITDGVHTEYGDRILCRAVVRYTLHRLLGPCIFLERVYKKDCNIDDTVITALFAAALYQDSKLPVIYDFCKILPHNMPEQIIIPQATIVQKRFVEASYRDSGVDYLNIYQQDVNEFPSLKTFQTLFST